MDPLQGADFDELQARLRASLAQKAGLAPADPSAAPPVADAGSPSPGSGPAAPQTTTTSTPQSFAMDANGLGRLVGMLGPEFSPDAYRKAQELDWDKTNRNQMMEGARQILSAQGNVPYQPRPTENNVEQTMLANRRQNILGSAESAGKLQGLILQQSMMTAGSPMSRIMAEQMIRMAPDHVAKVYGDANDPTGQTNIRNTPGFVIQRNAEAREKLATVTNTESDAWKKVQDVSAHIRELDQAYELKKQELAQAVSEGDKNRATSIESKMLELQNTREMFQAQNPRVVSDRYVYVGPGVPPAGLREKFNNNVQAPTLETARKLDELIAEHQRLEKLGVLGRIDPSESARLKSISEGITSALSRRAAGGNSPSQAEIELSKQMVPGVSWWKDSLALGRVVNAAKQTRADIMADMDSQARGYLLAPIPPGMSPRDAESGLGGSFTPPVIRMKTPDGRAVDVPPDKVQEAIHKYRFTLVPGR